MLKLLVRFDFIKGQEIVLVHLQEKNAPHLLSTAFFWHLGCSPGDDCSEKRQKNARGSSSLSVAPLIDYMTKRKKEIPVMSEQGKRKNNACF